MSFEETDKSKQEKFFEYYASASDSDETRQRFEATMSAVLGVIRSDDNQQEVFDVTDVGCGAGTQSLIWALGGHRVSAIDINKDLVELGKERASRAEIDINFLTGSATEIPLPDSSADVVLVPELLEHVPEWELVLDECSRLVRPGGYLYLSTTNRMCPVQYEFELPMYSWYPKKLQRYCEEKARTTRPQWANFADWPAVTWFTPYGLSKSLVERGFSHTYDRFDINRARTEGGAKDMLLSIICHVAPLRWLAHVLTPYTVLVARK
jgi:2-polyprenyl-6-hydroxyphenyl methylase/3-demethylubiquinone-9 3-methyltransferase